MFNILILWTNYIAALCHHKYLVWQPFAVLYFNTTCRTVVLLFYVSLKVVDIMMLFNLFLFNQRWRQRKPRLRFFIISSFISSIRNSRTGTFDWFWSPEFIWWLVFCNTASTSWNQFFQTSQTTVVHVRHNIRYEKLLVAARCCHVANDLTNFTNDRLTNKQTN